MAGIVRSRMWRSLLKGITRLPSATSAAISFIFGPSAPTRIFGIPKGLGPGAKAGVMSVCVVYSPRNSRRVPSCQLCRIAFVARTHSRI